MILGGVAQQDVLPMFFRLDNKAVDYCDILHIIAMQFCNSGFFSEA